VPTSIPSAIVQPSPAASGYGGTSSGAYGTGVSSIGAGAAGAGVAAGGKSYFSYG